MRISHHSIRTATDPVPGVTERWTRPALLACGAFLLLAAVDESQAAVVTLDATDSGFVTVAGGSAKGDGTITPATYNYSVGHEIHFDDGSLSGGFAPMDRKNYFVFDLSGVTDPIISATLDLYAGTYESADPTETFDIGETTAAGAALGDIGALAAGNAIGASEFDDPADPLIGVAAALYTKLADGGTLASAVVSAADDGTTISIAFNPFGIAYLNGFLGATVVLGGVLPTAPGPATPEAIFGFTDVDIAGGDVLTPELMLVTADPGGIPAPTPVSAVLLVVGLLGMAARQAGGRGRFRGA